MTPSRRGMARQRALAHTAWTREGHEPLARQQRSDLFVQVGAPNDGAKRRGQVAELPHRPFRASDAELFSAQAFGDVAAEEQPIDYSLVLQQAMGTAHQLALTIRAELTTAVVCQ